MAELDIPRGISLDGFLTKELRASTLTVRSTSKEEITIESNSIVRVHVKIDQKAKSISFDLFSPRWSRRITVEQLGGFEFMESQAEEQLLKEDAEAIAEDTLLSLDLIRSWGRKNGYEASEVEPTQEITSPEQANRTK